MAAMETFTADELHITISKTGADRYAKISYPLRYGIYTEIQFNAFTFGFNLNGEIKTISGRGRGWLDAAEWLKRTAGDDWIYFYSGGYTGAYDFMGEYYIPCLSYSSNAVFGRDRFESEEVAAAFNTWQQLQTRIAALDENLLPESAARVIRKIRLMTPSMLKERADRLHGIIGGPVSVLPPDARHVEYDVIPVIIADGCLYHCGFCSVKSERGFTPRTRKNIDDQIRNLKSLYDAELKNCSSVFLGQHDALQAGADLIEYAAKRAYTEFNFKRAFMKEPRLFLFGSADSLLNAPESLFERVNRLPFTTHINIGLESADQQTLRLLQKPLSTEKVSQAFHRMIRINQAFSQIEVSANFVYGANLPEPHLPSILDLTRNQLSRPHAKGAVYFSPLADIGSKRALLNRFMEFKKLCRLPAFLYLIQRL